MQMWSHLLVVVGAAPDSLKPSKTYASIDGKADDKKKNGWFGGKKKDVVDESTDSFRATRDGLKKELGPVTSEEFNQTLWRMFRGDHPDNLLLRFLRARKWVVHDAIMMLGETLRWRYDYGVEKILTEGEEIPRENGEDGFILQYTSKKCYIWGHDFKGRPIVHVRPRFHDPKAQSEKDLEKFTILIIESARLCLHDYVDTANVIFDLSDFSMSNMDYNAVKFIIKCFEAHYPESLGFILIHKAPWIFQGIWNIIKGWIDPVVASKISFTRNYNDMSKFIADEYIPKELGGKREHEYEYIEPEDGENALLKDEAKFKEIDDKRYQWGVEFQEATLDWIQASDDDARKKAQDKKNELAEKLRASYWEFDKYYRRATVFDRNGLYHIFHPSLKQDNKAVTNGEHGKEDSNGKED